MLSKFDNISYQLFDRVITMSERVQVIFRWDKDKLEQLKAWIGEERLTMQEVLEALATRFLSAPDRGLIVDNSNKLSTDNKLVTDLIARLERVENTVSDLELQMGESAA